MVKITQKLAKAFEEDRPFWSFEFFPPKTEAGVTNLYDRFERMYALGPEFIDVTWGAGGSTSDVTIQICNTAQAVYGLETCMHLYCFINTERARICLEKRLISLSKKQWYEIVMLKPVLRDPEHLGAAR